MAKAAPRRLLLFFSSSSPFLFFSSSERRQFAGAPLCRRCFCSNTPPRLDALAASVPNAYFVRGSVPFFQGLELCTAGDEDLWPLDVLSLDSDPFQEVD